MAAWMGATGERAGSEHGGGAHRPHRVARQRDRGRRGDPAPPRARRRRRAAGRRTPRGRPRGGAWSRPPGPRIAAADRFTDDARRTSTTTIDIICELMGGVEPARGLLVRAREREVRRHGEQGAPASHGEELYTAQEAGNDLYFEAAVPASAIGRPGVVGGRAVEDPRHRQRDDELHPHPDVRTRVDGRRSGRERSVSGCEAVRPADVEGTTRRRSARSSLGLRRPGRGRRRLPRGSRRSPQNFGRGSDRDQAARDRELDDDRGAHRRDPGATLASVPGGSAVFVEGPKTQQLMFYGAGAGGDPGDRGGRRSRERREEPAPGRARTGSGSTNARRVRPMDDTHDQYYLKLRVDDRPGVLAEIADRFGRNGIRWSASGRKAPVRRRPCRSSRRPRRARSRRRARTARAGCGARRGQRAPGGRRGVTVTGAPQWRGIIEEYREWLPITAEAARDHLREGAPASDRGRCRRDRLRG